MRRIDRTARCARSIDGTKPAQVLSIERLRVAFRSRRSEYMNVQAQKSGRRARKLAAGAAGNGMVAHVERDKDIQRLVAADAEARTRYAWLRRVLRGGARTRESLGPVNAMFGPITLDRLEAALATPRAWLELALVLAAFVAGWLGDRWLERRTAGPSGSVRLSGRMVRFSMPLAAATGA